jgi:hypothetical protein
MAKLIETVERTRHGLCQKIDYEDGEGVKIVLFLKPQGEGRGLEMVFSGLDLGPALDILYGLEDRCERIVQAE